MESQYPKPPTRTDPLHPAHDAVPLHRMATEVIAEWPSGTFLENLTPGVDGDWFVTSPSDCAVYRISPDESVATAAQFDATPTGIVSHAQLGVLIAVGTQGQPDWRLFGITLDGPKEVSALPDVLGANGMLWVGERLLVVDSPRSAVVTVDVTAGTAEVWLQHPLLTPVDQDSVLPGINGLTRSGGYVVMTSSDRGLILRVPTASRRPDVDVEVVAERLVGDDLAATSDGRLFIATHTYDSVLCLHPDGRREDIAVHDDGVAGPTAIAIGEGPSPKLYVTTTGGLLSPPQGGVEPARLLRIAIP